MYRTIEDPCMPYTIPPHPLTIERYKSSSTSHISLCLRLTAHGRLLLAKLHALVGLILLLDKIVIYRHQGDSDRHRGIACILEHSPALGAILPAS